MSFLQPYLFHGRATSYVCVQKLSFSLWGLLISKHLQLEQFEILQWFTHNCLKCVYLSSEMSYLWNTYIFLHYFMILECLQNTLLTPKVSTHCKWKCLLSVIFFSYINGIFETCQGPITEAPQPGNRLKHRWTPTLPLACISWFEWLHSSGGLILVYL